ncbi:NAD(P)H-hydrate dehydratase [Legionella israelensis]|nr:NAD(P)H-hydrate dehydratase [Legionella israelensis]QDP71821.1 NAD(P)H-hydrate dehydratase [Legionella israelensis]
MIPPEHKLYQCEQIRCCEDMAINQYNISEHTLMLRAGEAAFETVLKRFPHIQRMAIFCGAGNNAGDGYVLARLAQQYGLSVKIYQLKSPENLPSAAAHAAMHAMVDNIPCAWLDEPFDTEVDLIVDALLGIGLQGEVRGEMMGAINLINETELPVIALDIPSGLNADTGQVYNCCVRADCTICFIGRKTGMYTLDGPDHCGEIYCADLQLQDILEQLPFYALQLTRQTIDLPLPPRKKNCHKGDFGHALVVGGGPGMPGAVALAAKAALRTGAGAVTVATRPEHITGVLPFCPEIMVHGVRSENELKPLLRKATVCILGPGLGVDEWGKKLFHAAITAQLPMIIDASALRLLAEHPQIDDNWILTPHPGEGGALLSCTAAEIQKDRFEAVEKLQKQYGGVIILKGAGSIVRTVNAENFVCIAGNAGMATAGMGDILNGIIAGLLAQGLSLSESAKAGVWLHAHVADQIVQRQGERGLLASDLLAQFPKFINGLSI